MPAINEISFNKVLHAITKKLSSVFPNAKIHDEEVPQELDPPAFFVKLLSPSQTGDLNIRSMRYHYFDIHYFDPNYSNVAMNDTADQLYDVLEWIEIDGRPIRGISMNHEVVDRVLHFFIDYNFTVKRIEPDEPTMEDLDLQEGLKQ